MRKMKLDVDALAVESFSLVAGDTDGRGTIGGNQGTALCTRLLSCGGGDTCDQSCTGSCRTYPNCQQVC